MWLPEILMKSYWQNTKTYYGVYNDDIVLNVFRSCYLNRWFCKFGYSSVMMILTNKTCEVFQPQCRSQCYGRQSPRPGRPGKSILVMVVPYGSWQIGPNCTRPDYLGQLGPGQLSPGAQFALTPPYWGLWHGRGPLQDQPQLQGLDFRVGL